MVEGCLGRDRERRRLPLQLHPGHFCTRAQASGGGLDASTGLRGEPERRGTQRQQKKRSKKKKKECREGQDNRYIEKPPDARDPPRG